MPGTLHTPSACHPEFAGEVSCAAINEILLPAKGALKVIASVTVNVFPLPLSELPAPAIEHWLFCTVAAPGNNIAVKGPPASPASSTSSTDPAPLQ